MLSFAINPQALEKGALIPDFVRDGVENLVKKTAHLGSKWGWVKWWNTKGPNDEQVNWKNLDVFVEHLASKSSSLDEPYYVQCPHHAEQITSNEWINNELLAQ